MSTTQIYGRCRQLSSCKKSEDLQRRGSEGQRNLGGCKNSRQKALNCDMTNMVTLEYNTFMKRVNISKLKARLSAHIRFVEQGEEVIVCDRNRPVARIVPCASPDYSEEERRLIARGVLTPPLKKPSSVASWPKPPGNVPDELMEQVWQEEREQR